MSYSGLFVGLQGQKMGWFSE